VSVVELLWLVAPPLCWGCGDAVRGGGPICRRCRGQLRWLGHTPVEAGGVPAWAPLAYDGPARALVGGLKFRGAAGLADALAGPIVASAPEGWLAPAPGALWVPPVLVPVPLHPSRRRRRGFNQAERLAAAVARRTGLRVADCLERVGGRSTQVGRGRAERLRAVAGSVALRPGALAPPRPLLVDDVITTGATLSACASVLRAGGSEGVRAVAYARTPGR
jgi:ComF family protein